MTSPQPTKAAPILQAELIRNQITISELELLLAENIGIISSISSDISTLNELSDSNEKSKSLDYIETIQNSNFRLDVLSTKLSKLNEILKTII